MQIIEFADGTLRFLERMPENAPPNGFIWIFTDRASFVAESPVLQAAAQALGGSPLLDLHLKDLANSDHPSHYDYTSIYDLVIFRRLATDAETREESVVSAKPRSTLAAFQRIATLAVGFIVFDRLLITVHPDGCYAANTFIQRYLQDAVHNEGLSASARSRLPSSPADLMLRMLNLIVDSYLDLRTVLSSELDRWQQQLLAPGSREADWSALMSARRALHKLEGLCEGQNDAMLEWLDTQREQPAPWMPQAERDTLLARARDVVEHIQRVQRHVHRMEQGAETAVQIHFSVIGHRTNEIMRVLTALTAVFLPLNFLTGFFGMNFEFLPLIHSPHAMWLTFALMAGIGIGVLLVFWRMRYIARVGK